MGDVALFTCILSGNAHICLPYRDRSKQLMATATTITDAMAETAIAATAAQAKPRDSDPFRKGDLVVYLRMVLAPLIRSDLNRSADIAST